jgi:hypothetical protein
MIANAATTNTGELTFEDFCTAMKTAETQLDQQPQRPNSPNTARSGGRQQVARILRESNRKRWSLPYRPAKETPHEQISRKQLEGTLDLTDLLTPGALDSLDSVLATEGGRKGALPQMNVPISPSVSTCISPSVSPTSTIASLNGRDSSTWFSRFEASAAVLAAKNAKKKALIVAKASLPIVGEHDELDTEADEKQEREALINLWTTLDGKGWRRSQNWCSDKPLGEWEGIKTVSGRVEEIKLTNNTLRGSIPASIEKLVLLKRLLLAENFVQGPIPEAIGKCTNLEVIMLNDNEITGDLPASMSCLHKLQQLNVSENSITGTIPASWRRLANVESIVLWGNQLSGSLPWTTGQQAPKLRYLDLRNNRFRDEEKEGIRLTFGEQVPAHNLSI